MLAFNLSPFPSTAFRTGFFRLNLLPLTLPILFINSLQNPPLKNTSLSLTSQKHYGKPIFLFPFLCYASNFFKVFIFHQGLYNPKDELSASIILVKFSIWFHLIRYYSFRQTVLQNVRRCAKALPYILL